MNQSGNGTTSGKIESITNILWRLWWFTLFFLILPFGIAGVSAFVINQVFSSQIPWIEELSYSVFLLIIPVLVLLFMIPYEKYRKNKFFMKRDLPSSKHIVLFTLLPCFSLTYSKLIEFLLTLLLKDYSFFFGETQLFNRILTPLTALIVISYYISTRKSSTVIFKPTIKTIDRLIITLSLVLQSFSIIFLPSQTLLPFLILNSAFFLVFIASYFLTGYREKKNVSNILDFKIRLIFNIFTVMHLISSALLIGWIFWIIYDLNVWTMGIQTPIILILTLKGMIIFSYNQITRLKLPEFSTPQGNLKKINIFLAFSGMLLVLGFFIYTWNQLLFGILSVAYGLIIYIWIVLDHSAEIISKFAAKLASIASSFVVIFYIAALPPIDIIYQVIIASVILYLNLYLLAYWKILDKSRVAVAHAFLFSAILMEVFYALGDLAVIRLIPLLSDPNQVIWLRIFLFGFAFSLSSIISLFRVVIKRFKGKISRFIKWVFLILHTSLGISLVAIVYLTLGTSIVGILAPYWLFFKILLPFLVYIPINTLVFVLYFRYGIYSKRGLINIIGYSINLFSVFAGLSAIVFLLSLGAYLILAFLLTVGIIIHLYIRKQNQLLEKTVYRKCLAVFHPLMLFEINFGLLLVLIQNLSLPYSFSIFISMLSTQILLVLMRKLKFVFTERFSKWYNITALFLQAVFLPLYVNPLVKKAILEYGIDLTAFLSSYLPFLILFIYSSILFTYSIKSGITIRKIWLKIANLCYLGMYMSIALIPSYFLEIFIGNSSDVSVLAHLFYSSIVLLFSFVLDTILIHGLMIGPQKWILQAINANRISMESEVLSMKKLSILERATGLQLNLGNENEIRLNTSIISEFLNQPSKFFGLRHSFEKFISGLIWIFSIVVNIISVIFIIQILDSFHLSYTLTFLLPGILSYTTIILLTKMMLITDRVKITLYNINFIYNVFSCAIVLFPLIQSGLIPIMGLLNASIIAFDASAAFAFCAFQILKRRLVQRSPGFYYITLFSLWIVFASAFIFSIGFVTNLISSISALQGTLFSNIFSNTWFVAFLTTAMIFIAILGAIGYIFKYNTIYLKRNPIYTVFSLEELNSLGITEEELNFFKKRGFAKKKTEYHLRKKMRLLNTYLLRHIVSLITYFFTPISVFILGILLADYGISLFTSSLLMEATIAYLSGVLLLFFFDYRVLKFVNRELNNQIRCFVWIFFQLLLSFFAAFILEPELWYGKILLFLQVFSMLMPPLNYFLKHSGFKVHKWMQRSEISTKILIIATSTAYLANLSITTLHTYIYSPSTFIFGILPYLLLSAHLIFHITYFQKETSLRRYYRTYNRSYPCIMIALYLIRYRTSILAYFPSWTPVLIYILPIISVVLIWWSLFYYYSMVRQFNVIMNFFYQVVLIFIGVVFIQYLAANSFSMLWGYGYLVIDQILFSCGLSFIVYYYMRKAAYFEIYKGFLDEEPIRFRAVGIIAGIIRTIGIIFLVGFVLRITGTIFSISITRWAMGTFTPTQFSIINSTFIWSIASFIGLFLFMFFLKGYFKNFAQHSYNSRFVVRIWTVLSAAIAIGMSVILYEPIYFYAFPPLLILNYIWLYFIQKKNPYRGNLTIGTAKSILIFLFVFWVIHQYVFGLAFQHLVIDRNILLLIELFLSAGMTGFAFSRSFKNIIIKAKKFLTWIILLSAVGEISYAAFLILTNLGMLVGNPLIVIDPILTVTLTLNFSILLLYLAVAIQQWKISKKIWDVAWWLWLFLPIINFTLIYDSIRGVDVITQTFTVFGVSIPGSILLTIIITTLLYLPVILTKFQKAYKFFFFITWIEAIPVWIWLAPNLFSSYPSVFLSPLFVIGLSLISLVPFLFSLKYWRLIAGVWVIIAVTNAIFLSLLINVEFVPNILMDIFLHICTYGLYLIIFLANPVIKSSWKRYDYGILLGFILFVVGASFIVFGFAFMILGNILYAISISGFVTGAIMISGRYVKLIQQKINPYAILLIAVSLGFGTFLFLLDFQIFPVDMDFSWTFLNEFLRVTLFPFSVALVSSCGVVLLAQAREFINKKRWRLVFAFFSMGIGFTAGCILDSLLGLSNPLFAAVTSFWVVMASYPTFRWKKPIFWGLFPIFLAYSVVFGFEYLNIRFSLAFDTILGFNYTLWICAFSLISILVHNIVSVYFTQKYFRVTKELVDMGISDYKTLPFPEEVTDKFVEQQNEIAQKLIHDLEILPKFYVSPRKMHQLYSLLLIFFSYSVCYLLAFFLPLPLLYQLQMFIFGISLSTFIVLEYNKRKGIFGNPTFIRSVRFIASNLLYASILYGIIILNQYIVPVLLDFVPSSLVTPSMIPSLTITLDSLFFYIIFLGLSNWIRFYGKVTTLLVKISSWLCFLTGLGFFIGYLVNYMFSVIFSLTIGSYVIVVHLKSYHKHLDTNLRLLAKSTSGEASINSMDESIAKGEQLNLEEISLGIDVPVPILPPSEIHHEDLASEADFEEVKDVLDSILPGEAPMIEYDEEEEGINIEQPSYNQELQHTLQLIVKQEKRSKMLKSFINGLDACIRQGVIIEFSYLIALVLSNLLPKVDMMHLYHVYIFRFFMFVTVAVGFYNIRKLVPEKFRTVMVQVFLTSMLVLTVITPFSIIYVYGTELKLIGDGISLPLGELYIPNIMFMTAIALFLFILELELVIWNFALTKNKHLQKPLMDKWNDVLQPILLILAAFIIANSFSFNQPFITRIVYASLVLFGEAILEKYVLHLFNRLTRARILFYSWVLINILGIIQVFLLLPSLSFPITLGMTAAMVVLGAQFITLYLYYQLKNEKIARNYNIDENALNNYKFKIFSRTPRLGRNKIPLMIEQYKNADKLIEYKDFIKSKYSFMAILGYILLSFLVSALIYETWFFRYIIEFNQQLQALGINWTDFSLLWNHPVGIRFILLTSAPFSIVIILGFVLFYQDQHTLRLVRVIPRDLFMIFFWILISASLMFYALGLIQLFEGVTFSNLITVGICLIIAVAQYYSIYLFTDISIHSAKNMKKLESIHPAILLETKSHNELMEMLSQIEPRSLKIVKTVNLIFAILIYSTISLLSYILVYFTSKSVVIALCSALLILYAQAELNNYVLKAFPPQVNFWYSLISWGAFSLSISLIIPIIFWNQPIIWIIDETRGFFIEFTNIFLIFFATSIFNGLFFITALILRRIISDYVIKYTWMKSLRMIMYFIVTITLFFLFLPTSPLLALFIASIVLYLEMVVERYLPIYMDKTTRLIRSIAAFSMSVIISYWTYMYLENSFDFELAFSVALLIFTLLSQLIYNYWEHKKIAGPIFWAVVSSETGFLISSILVNGIFISIGSGVVMMMLYPVIFEFRQFLKFFENLLENLRIAYLKVLHFFKNFWVYMRNFYKKYKIIITLIMDLGIFVGLFFIIRPYFLIYQAIFISAAIASSFLFPIFITPKTLKDEKKFSRMVYYAAIVYVFANIALFSFVRINIVWFLLSLVLFSSILLVVIYRRETLYNLSIRWRFFGLVITIASALALVTILALFFLNIIFITF